MKLNVNLLSENIKNRAGNDIKENNISGISVAVINGNEVIYKAHFGTLSAEDNTPVDDNTLFRMASMTKPITAVAVMTLFDKGLIKPDDPVEKYLPQFRSGYIAVMRGGKAVRLRKSETALTVKHLLTHTSGILSGDVEVYYTNGLSDEAKKTLKGTVDYYATTGLGFEPYSKEQYSATAAFDVLARIIEVISGIDYAEFVKKYVTAPCGMTDTTFIPTKEQWQRVIPMHEKTNGKSGVYEMPKNCVFEDFPTTHPLGGAGLVSSLKDYAAFAGMLLNKGEINGNRVITEEAVKLISAPQVPESIMPGNARWGFGVRVITSENYKYLPVGTFGWSGAYGTHFWVDSVNNIAAVYMKNSRYDGGSGAVTAYNFEKDVFNSFVK
ncbi:MAG: serine hydrolase domain-containing protein [Monoglobaceae bacterium]